MGKARRTALVVEDDVDTLTFIQSALAGEYNVTTASTRDAAWERIGIALPDFIVVDYLMPGMDAYSFMRCIWKVAPLLPVMFISAYDDGNLVADRLGLPFLRKPFDADMLRTFVAINAKK
jgi:CheY-like chemotaxis protein